MKYLWYLLILVGFIGARDRAPLFSTYHLGTPGVYFDFQNLKATYSIVSGDIIVINAGTYPGGIITNSRFGTSGITIRASDSGSIFTSGLEVTNVQGIIFSRLQFRNIGFRALMLKQVDSCNIQDCNFYKVTDYVWYIDGTDGSYDGTAATRFNNVNFFNDTVRSVGPAVNVLSTNGSRSVTAYCTVRNCWFDSTYGTPSSCLSFTANCIGDTIDRNKFTNINLSGTDHNSVVYWQGWGVVSNNLCNNRQGDFIRCRPYTVDSSATNMLPDTTYVYNNRDCSARKYAFIEMQHKVGDTSTNTTLPNTRTGILLCLNNTCLNTRTADYTPFVNASGGGAGLADVYDWFRPPIFKNNVCGRAYLDSVPDPYNPPSQFTFNYMFHSGGGSKPVGQPVFGDTSNNIYMNPLPNLSVNWSTLDSLTMNIIAGSVPIGNGTSSYRYLFSSGYRGNTRQPIWDQGADQFNTYFLTPVPFNVIKTVR